MDLLKMYSLLKMGIFHGYVSLPDGKWPFQRMRDLQLGILVALNHWPETHKTKLQIRGVSAADPP